MIKFVELEGYSSDVYVNINTIVRVEYKTPCSSKLVFVDGRSMDVDMSYSDVVQRIENAISNTCIHN